MSCNPCAEGALLLLLLVCVCVCCFPQVATWTFEAPMVQHCFQTLSEESWHGVHCRPCSRCITWGRPAGGLQRIPVLAVAAVSCCCLFQVFGSKLDYSVNLYEARVPFYVYRVGCIFLQLPPCIFLLGAHQLYEARVPFIFTCRRFAVGNKCDLLESFGFFSGQSRDRAADQQL